MNKQTCREVVRWYQWSGGCCVSLPLETSLCHEYDRAEAVKTSSSRLITEEMTERAFHVPVLGLALPVKTMRNSRLRISLCHGGVRELLLNPPSSEG